MKFKDFQAPVLFSSTFKALNLQIKNSSTFKDFQAPVLFSSTFKALNLGIKNSSTFKDFQGCVGTLLRVK